jgi:pilus assembly protein CpaE
MKAVPRIAIQAFCETPAVASTLEAAAADRRMERAHVKVHMGGLAAAVEFYSAAPTPNLLFVETRGTAAEVLAQLDTLSDVCDPGSKVVVIGHVNDVLLYRELIRRGVSEYMVAPFDLFDAIRTVGDLYGATGKASVGKVIAFIGAKGGAGSSTIAHNVGFMLSRASESDVVIADLDLAFGTAGLDFNQDPPQSIADALFSPERFDEAILDRLLAKCAENLSLLAAPATLDRSYDLSDAAISTLLDTTRASVPSLVLDLPHAWSGWVRHALASADEIVITALPDLASLRNTKNLIDQLKMLRPNDGAPHLVLNQVGMPKRPEIKPEDFKKTLGIEPIAIIPFEPALFGSAANNGQMVAEVNAKSPIADLMHGIGEIVSGRSEARKFKKGGLAPLFARFRAKK